MPPSKDGSDNPNGAPPQRWPNALLIIATLAALSGVLVLLFRPDSNPGIEISLPTPTPPPQLKVYVSGAVAQPGVYQFHEGDRLIKAVQSAGGLLPNADSSAINMAALLQDEQHYHFPLTGESANEINAPSTQDEPHTTELPPLSPENPLNINVASQEQLQLLPGIGEVKAHAIVDFRNAHGPFAETSEITSVPGIGPTTYENVRHLITVASSP